MKPRGRATSGRFEENEARVRGRSLSVRKVRAEHVPYHGSWSLELVRPNKDACRPHLVGEHPMEDKTIMGFLPGGGGTIVTKC